MLARRDESYSQIHAACLDGYEHTILEDFTVLGMSTPLLDLSSFFLLSQ